MPITLTTSVAAVPGANLTRTDVVSSASSAGRISTNPLKDPAVDPLSSGATYSGNTIAVSGDNVVLEDWAIARIGGTGNNLTIRNCVLTDPGLSGAAYMVEPNGAGWLIEQNDLRGPGGAPTGGSALIVNRGESTTIRLNSFSAFAFDGIKSEASNVLIEHNRFHDYTPVSPDWVAQAYSAGEHVRYNARSYIAQQNTLASDEPGVSAAWGSSIDPHLDVISCNGYSGVVRYNHFVESASPAGATQQIRLVRDTGSALPHGPWEVYGNVFEEWNGVYPLSVGVVREYVNRTYGVGGFAARSDNRVYYRAVNATSVDPEVDATDWVEDRDIGAVEDVLFAYNWIENNGEIFNGDKHRLTAGVNYDLNGNEFTPVDGAYVLDISSPDVGNDLIYTHPTQYGPSQKFTITPSAYGAARVAGVMYQNACVIRAGIQVVAMVQLIDGVRYWRTMQNSGVTMEDAGGGAFVLRIYDSAGNPMQATADIPAGAAAVAAEADEVATSVATPWGDHLGQTNYVDTTNLIPDGSFDDAVNQSSWENTTDWVNFGVVAGGLLQIKPAGSGSVYSVPANNAPALTENTTYHILFEVSRLDHADTSKRLRIELDGTRTPSTYAPSSVGTHGPWTYTTGPGQTTARIRIQIIDAGFDMDISDFIIRPA